MGRILAIDYGKKRTGLAVTDSLQIIATPLDMILTKNLDDYLKNYLMQETVEKIIIGWSTNLKGGSTDISPQLSIFFEKWTKFCNENHPQISIIKHDERFTSKMALDTMITMGTSKKERRKKTGNIDKISATIILQSYMASCNQ